MSETITMQLPTQPGRSNLHSVIVTVLFSNAIQETTSIGHGRGTCIGKWQ